MSYSPSLSQSSFLIDAFGIAIDESGTAVECESLADELVSRCVHETLESGVASIRQTDNEVSETQRVAMAIPVYSSDSIVSLAVFVARVDANVTGVFEWWQPVGEYDELNLAKGYFGTLERFQNVSSFVRFEKGSGLPGQVWRDLCFTIHDSLPSHPGFLRAAGASAGSLEVAIGIPVRSTDFLGSVLLISADATPLAQCYEVWRCDADDLTLESVASQRLDSSLLLKNGTSLGRNESFAGKAWERGQVVVSNDPEVVFAGRSNPPSGECHGMAIPFFEDGRVTNILTLIF